MDPQRDPDTPPASGSTASAAPGTDGAPGTSSRTRDIFASPSSPANAAAKADLGKRFIAALIDGAVAAVLGVIPVIGGILGAAYLVVRDGLEVDFMNHRSLGKHLMKLRPVRLDGRPVDLETSFRRNWMFGLGALAAVLAWIPILGWALLLLLVPLGLAIGLYEAYRVLTDDEGRRWGDTMAGTKVIEVTD